MVYVKNVFLDVFFHNFNKYCSSQYAHTLGTNVLLLEIVLSINVVQKTDDSNVKVKA